MNKKSIDFLVIIQLKYKGVNSINYLKRRMEQN